MMARPPFFASLPHGSRSRNWTDSVLRALLPSRRPVRSAPLRRSLKAPARFAHAWSRSSSPGGRPPTGGPCIAAPSNARRNSKPKSTGFRPLLRLREQQLFGRKTEAGTTTEPTDPPADLGTPPPRRKRGQQRGQKGPKRRDHSHLPAVIEDHQLPPEQCCCWRCGQPFDDFPGTEDAIILEVEVRAHRRVIRRRRSRPTCSCAAHPGIVVAPPPPRLIPKSILGVSIWVDLLLDKYRFDRPTYRCLADWATHGLDLSLGTITDGLKHLTPLFEPVYEALVQHSQGQTLWHADETRWLVFVVLEGKVGDRWYLWVFHSAKVVVFVLAAGRSHDVPEEHFGPVEGRGILVVDRYKAYQAIDKVQSGRIVLAFCWRTCVGIS